MIFEIQLSTMQHLLFREGVNRCISHLDDESVDPGDGEGREAAALQEPQVASVRRQDEAQQLVVRGHFLNEIMN